MADNLAVTPGSGATVGADSIGGILYQRINMPESYTGGTTTRPGDTTTYAFGDLVANSTTAGSVVPAQIQAARSADLPFTITGARLKKSTNTTALAIFNIHLFNVLPTFANGDNAAFAAGVTLTSGYLGFMQVTCDQQGSDVAKGIGSCGRGPSIIGTPVSGQNYLYYVLEARGAYAPGASEVFTPELQVL